MVPVHDSPPFLVLNLWLLEPAAKFQNHSALERGSTPGPAGVVSSTDPRASYSGRWPQPYRKSKGFMVHIP